MSQAVDRGAALLERSAAADAARAAVEAAESGKGALRAYTGPIGIGRTAMLGEAARLATRSGAVVLRAACVTGERALPYGVVLQLLEDYVSELDEETARSVFAGRARFAATVLPVHGVDGGALQLHPEETMLMVQALHRLAANAAAISPIVMLVDDVQWADEPSLRFLRFLARRVSNIPLSLILTARDGWPEDTEDAVADLLGCEGCVVESLQPLSEGSVRALVARGTGGCSPQTARTCYGLSRGNPALVQTLTVTARSSGRPLAGRTASEVCADAAEPVCDRLLASHLQGMPKQARDVLAAVAVLNWTPSRRRLDDTVGLDSDRVGEALDALARAGILNARGSIGFEHPLVRTAVYDRIPDVERRRLHGRAAGALRADDADPSQIVQHLLRARSGSRPWAAEAFREAARQARKRGAIERATLFLRRALAESPSDHVRTEIKLELGRAESELGEVDHAIETLKQAAADAGPEERSAAALELARAFRMHGEPHEAAALLEDALRASWRDGPARGRLEAAWLSAALVDPELRDEAIRRVESDDGDLIESNPSLAATMASHLALAGRSRERVIALADVAASEGANDGDAAAWAATLQAFCLSGELKRARELAAGLAARPWVQSSPRALLSVRLASAHLAYLSGNLREAERDLTVVETLIESKVGADYRESAQARRAAICIERGQFDRAEQIIDAATGAGAPGDPLEQAQLLCARARVHTHRQRHEEALADAVEAGRVLTVAGIENPIACAWMAHAAHAAKALDRHEEARRFAREQLRVARRLGAEPAMGEALTTLAAVTPKGRAIDMLVEAEAILRSSGAVLAQVRCLVSLGDALRRRGSRKHARATLRRAQRIAARLGLKELEATTRSELRLAGARKPRSSPTGVGALTVSERRVADLAAMGLTNREIAEQLFVTKKTVEWHLRNTFRKLEVESRAELIRMLSPGESERKKHAGTDVDSPGDAKRGPIPVEPAP